MRYERPIIPWKHDFDCSANEICTGPARLVSIMSLYNPDEPYLRQNRAPEKKDLLFAITEIERALQDDNLADTVTRLASLKRQVQEIPLIVTQRL